MPDPQRIAVVTGASSGIGEATCQALAAAGFHIVAGARRQDRLKKVIAPLGGEALPLDVTQLPSIEAFVQAVGARHGRIDVLVNNAGLAAGLAPVAEGRDIDWVQMLETNVLGMLRMTRACLPLLRQAPSGHIVNLGSVAGFEVYTGGAGYTASKHAVRAITRTLRLELVGEPIRISEVAPGMVETEFSLVRFKGDAARAAEVYRGVQPLTGADVADCILWAVTRPLHVNIDELVVRPIAQANAFTVARRS
ncbi:MAG TPA: SDR family NAD(P)-dependent oxidoreductase [Candidatus Limnocylindria bacterium]|nr:SDR family NAD(P)-dependent oxidoreductase [Candidatus Limnocylindria bacterium]